MELDDLKRTWKQQSIANNKNTDIMELIHQPESGPLAALKKAFIRQIRIMILVPVILLFTNVRNWEATLTNVLFWSYCLFCLGIILFFWMNYRLVQRMEAKEGSIKQNLQMQINVLEERLRWKQRALPLALLYFVVVLELLPFFQHLRMLDKWHALSPLVRFGSYALFFVLQYVLSRQVAQRKFGRHLAHVKELVKEMQE